MIVDYINHICSEQIRWLEAAKVLVNKVGDFENDYVVGKIINDYELCLNDRILITAAAERKHHGVFLVQSEGPPKPAQETYELRDVVAVTRAPLEDGYLETFMFVGGHSWMLMASIEGEDGWGRS